MESSLAVKDRKSIPGSLQDTDYFFIFRVNKQSFALKTSAIDRVIRSVLITSVPGSPSSVKGVINLHGKTIPVIDFRRKFGFPAKKIELTDKLIILDTGTLKMALIADELIDITAQEIQYDYHVDKLIPGFEKQVPGLLLFKGEIILLYDIQQIFVEDAEKTIDLLKRKENNRKNRKS